MFGRVWTFLLIEKSDFLNLWRILQKGTRQFIFLF